MPANMTRERIKAARDEFRNSIATEQPAEQTVAQQSQPAVEQPVEQPQVAAPQPQYQYVQPQYQYVPPSADPYLYDETATLKQELSEARRLRDEAEAASASAKEELARYKDEQELNKYLSGQGDYGSIAPDDARKIIEPVLKSVRQERDGLRKQLAATQAAFDQRLNGYAAAHQRDATQKFFAPIMKAHPDLQSMQRHPAYAEVMLAPIAPGSRTTVGQMVMNEIQNGNSQYVINVLNEVRRKMSGGNTNAANALAAVSSVGATAPAAATAHEDNSGDRLSYEDMAELRYKLQTKQITRDQFRERMAKHREASKAS